MRFRKIAAVSTLALAAAGVATIAPAATAVSPVTDLTCTALGSPYQFTGAADTSLPAAATYGAKLNYKLTANMTIPQTLSSAAAGILLAKTAEGNGVFTVNGSVVKIAIAKTDVDGTKPLPLNISGNGSFVASQVGVTPVKVTAINANVLFKTATGEPKPLNDIPCVPAGGAIVADSITVTKANTKAKVKAKTKAGKGVVTVSVRGQNGTKATGKLGIKIGKKTFKGNVKNGVAKIKVKGLKKGKNKVSGVYAGDKNHNYSRIKGKVTIK